MNFGNMNMNFKDAVCYLTFKEFENFDFIKHAFSTRIGGVSKNEFASMNLGLNGKDAKENVLENYRRLCNAIDVDLNDVVTSSQDHGTFIRRVGESERGIGVFREHDIKSVDGLITNVPGVTLVTFYADCVPIYFLDPIKRVVGLVHAGWRGTVSMIGLKMIEKMEMDYDCDPSNIICAIGPSIGDCCFDVDKNVANKFLSLDVSNPKELVKRVSNDKFFVDLKNFNKKILVKANVSEKNIYVSSICTKCNSEILFSHRQTNGKRGTMVAIIKLEKRGTNNGQRPSM